MTLLMIYFSINLYLVFRMMWNLTHKLKDDKEAHEDANGIMMVTLFFGAIFWAQDIYFKLKGK